MKARLALLSAFLALPVLAACRTPESPTNPDASDASFNDVIDAACANMNKQGCTQSPGCADTLRTAYATHAVDAKFIACLNTAADVRATCGPQVRCGVTGDAAL